MAGGDAEKGEGGALGMTLALLPIAEGLGGDAHCLREAGLSQADESAKGGDVCARLEGAGHESLSNSGGNRSSKLLGGELGDLGHSRCSKEA